MFRLATVGLLAAVLWTAPLGRPRNDNRHCDCDDPAPPPRPHRTSVVEINRALALHMRADVDMLTSGARWSRPFALDGALGAFVYRVQPDSLLDVFGFRDGDFVEPPEWGDDAIRFRVRRHGRPLDIVLRVTET